jgi:hypothetical protein
MTKINWDAALDKSGDQMRVGVVARDHNENMVGALCCTRPFISDPTTAEAVGAWQLGKVWNDVKCGKCGVIVYPNMGI